MLAYWPKIRKQAPSRIIRQFNGVNKLDPLEIDPAYSPDTINRTINDQGQHATRPGYSVLGTAIGTRVLGLGVWKKIEIHAVFNDGTWRKWTGSAWSTPLASGLNTIAEWTFTNFKGDQADVCLFGTNGVDSARMYNGTTVSVLSGIPDGANYIAQFADRLWAAIGNELHASSYRMVGDWTTMVGDDADAWEVIPETPDGETINGIITDFTKLVVTKPSAIFKLMGYAPSDYTMQRVSLSLGQFNNKSSAVLDGWLYSLASRGLTRYAGGTDPERDFSHRVAAYFNRLDATGKPFSALGTDGEKIYASLAVNGPTPDTLIVYDPKRDTFFEWQGISALHFIQFGSEFYIGDATGRVLKLGGTTDAGTPISWQHTSVPFTAESMAQKLRIMRFWLTVDLDNGSTMFVDLSKSVTPGDWQNVGQMTAASTIQSKPFYVQSSQVGLIDQLIYKLYGTGQAITHEIAWDSIEYPVR